eukprot:CAMPEP_0176365306 /NCGR_PEP_ID=MMETSP0126-20121128/20372_1 /TAXON_ID=141414 ORGANISM="Strombidinopsis acuminatum, Strain SPMC142" /NCGR_SAMPLE_ID=MMETSP0126 /ASSEMBLY_ACC=CAM_ASM_000229 /LENGTH=1031 /DNA_ID=CAMNT_0017722243 /DNA_START=72 /DNA_END=3167 /DNA_ORIENTATION=-
MHGSKIAALLVALVALAAKTSAQITISPGTGRTVYISNSDVTAALALSTGVMKVTDAISKATDQKTTWDYVKREYVDFVKSTADANRAGFPTWDAFKDEYGSDNFTSDYFMKAVDGTAPGFTDVAVRKEMTEKTVVDMVTMITVLSMLEDAKRASSNDANSHPKWDQAAAYYIGAQGNQRGTTYARADFRGQNYGTVGASGESSVNTKIITALNAGKEGSRTVMDAQYEIILKQYQVLYAQATLRYAYIFEENLAVNDPSLMENVAEGQAFWRLIKPWVKAWNVTHAAEIDDMYDTTKPPNGANHYNYCKLKSIILDFLKFRSISETELGSLEAASDIIWCANTPLPSGLPSIVTFAGAYSPAGPVGGSLAFSEAVRTIVLNISDAPNNGAVVANIYLDSGLKGIADKNRAGEPEWDLFREHFGSATWMSDLITRATASPALIRNAGARAEIIEKTTMDFIAIQAMFSDFHHATNADHTEKNRRAFWDAGAAKFMGTDNARRFTVYRRSNLRGANFGTLEADGVTAKATKAIVTALVAGSTASTLALRLDALATVRLQINVIYAQATLRYAWIVDRDLAEGREYAEHQAEGLAFYNVIAPHVKAADPAGHAIIEAFFDVASVPDSYNYYAFCAIKAVMNKFLGAAATHLGVLENTGAVPCSTSLPTGLPKISTTAGEYFPASDVGFSLSFSIATRNVTSLIVDNPNYAAIRKAFKDLGLGGSADMVRTGEPVYDRFRTHFGSNTWISDYFYGAADGSLSTIESARVEMLEKTAVDAVAVNAILSDLYKGTLGTDTIARRYWDAGAAKFLGDNLARFGTKYDVVLSSTVYDRAVFRSRNYGTVLTDGGNDVAKANKEIIDALRAGATATSRTARLTEFQKIVTQIKVIYAQCTLRYAWLIDEHVKNSGEYLGHQAEGQAFFRVLAPWIKEVDANGATYLEGIFNINRAPTDTDHFCRAKMVLAKLDISASDMGVLERTESINCDGTSVPEDAANYLANDANNAVNSGASTRAAAALATALAAAVCSVALVFA